MKYLIRQTYSASGTNQKFKGETHIVYMGKKYNNKPNYHLFVDNPNYPRLFRYSSEEEALAGAYKMGAYSSFDMAMKVLESLKHYSVPVSAISDWSNVTYEIIGVTNDD